MTACAFNGGFKASYRVLRGISLDISSDKPDANDAFHEVITFASARSDLISVKVARWRDQSRCKERVTSRRV
jgi:hypothetical protein